MAKDMAQGQENKASGELTVIDFAVPVEHSSSSKVLVNCELADCIKFNIDSQRLKIDRLFVRVFKIDMIVYNPVIKTPLVPL